MDYLIDTQVFIWWMEENKKLPSDIKYIIDEPLNNIFVSVITPWEILIKVKTKKLKVPKNFGRFLISDTFKLISIQVDHVLGIRELPLYHKDPFDRILIAQAKTENLTLITSDEKIWKYNLKLIKA